MSSVGVSSKAAAIAYLVARDASAAAMLHRDSSLRRAPFMCVLLLASNALGRRAVLGSLPGNSRPHAHR